MKDLTKNNIPGIMERMRAKVKTCGITGLVFSGYTTISYAISTKVTTAIFKLLFDDCGQSTIIEKNVKIIDSERISLGDNVIIEQGVVLNASSLPRPALIIGDNSIIRQYSMLQTRAGIIEIGSNCSVNPFCMIYGKGNVTIGNYVRIATGSVIVAQSHIYSDTTIPITFQGEDGKGITIEDNVWIGAGAKILDGVTIGTGSVIGAGAVVTKDIPSFSVVAGVPAKVIKKRK